MPMFPKLDVDYLTCYAWKISRIIPEPSRVERTKNNERVGKNLNKFTLTLVKPDSKNKVKSNYPMTTRSKVPCTLSCAQENRLFDDIDFESYLSTWVHQKLVKKSALLRLRLKLNIPLKIDKLLNLLGTCSYVGFVFCDVAIIMCFKADSSVK